MANMLEQLGVPVHARSIAALQAPLADGIHLPAPHGVFPRYVEPAT
jgi:methionyl-tRNA synthetase